MRGLHERIRLILSSSVRSHYLVNYQRKSGEPNATNARCLIVVLMDGIDYYHLLQ
jgi:hypothetical protein